MEVRLVISMADAENLAGHSSSYRPDGFRWRAALAEAAGVELASMEAYEEYVKRLRALPVAGMEPVPLDGNASELFADSPNAEAACNELASGRSGDSSTFMAGVSRVLDHLGLHFG